MNKNLKRIVVLLSLITSSVFLFLIVGNALAEPSKAQVTKMWETQHNVKGRVLDVKSMGGQRTTNELHGKHYLTPVATCWDYNVVELQKCGCRLFAKSSACCRKGSSQDCELRIGDSKMIDCSAYGKPKFGLAGNTEPSECKSQRTQSSCWNRKDLVFGAGSTIGPCIGIGGSAKDYPPAFICPKGYDTVNDFHAKKCGPTPEDCGCTLVEECSTEEGLKCYKDWKANKLGAVDVTGSGKGTKEDAVDAAGSAIDSLKKKLW